MEVIQGRDLHDTECREAWSAGPGAFVYIEPSIYTSTLVLASAGADRYPLPATLFLLAILALLTVLMIGVLCHWRWLFWLLLIAFGSSILGVPATLLQLVGWLPAFPGPFPLWYRLYRMGIALIEVGMAVWMFTIYRRAGVWGQERWEKKAPPMI